jgi:hypothetical protein
MCVGCCCSRPSGSGVAAASCRGDERELLASVDLVLTDAPLPTGSPGDVGVCSIESADGIGSLCVAVAQAGHDDTALQARVHAAIEGHQFGPIALVRLVEIPRNANGKIERARLKATVVSVVGDPAKSSAPGVTPA